MGPEINFVIFFLTRGIEGEVGWIVDKKKFGFFILLLYVTTLNN